MDNIITGAFAVIIFLLFAGGLAQSIGAPPFIIIVVSVGLMLLVDFYQSAREGLQKERDKDSSPQS